MLKNHFTIAWRNLQRYKLHSAINVLGLAIGISACLVIFLLVQYQKSFDTFHPNKERIYRVYTRYSGLFDVTNCGIAYPVPAALRKEVSGVEAVGHFILLSNLKVRIVDTMRAEKTIEEQDKVVVTEPEFFKIFKTYRWLVGNPKISLDDPFKVVLTESRLPFYFGDIQPEEAIGREIVYNDSLRVTVSGVVRDLPKPTDLHFTEFISFKTIPQSWIKNDLGGVQGMKEWGSTTSASQVFIQAANGVQAAQLSKQFKKLVAKYQPDKDPKLKLEYLLEPLTKLRYSSIGLFNKSPAPAHQPTLNALLIIAGLLLLIACVNFVNLATAQSIQRAKEVGVRKVLGGTKGALILQFLSETGVVTTLAMLISTLLAKSALLFFKEFLPEGLTYRPFALNNLAFVAMVILVVSLLAGLYPAFVLSGFRPALALKSKLFAKGTQAGVEWLRKGLIVFQFTFSLALIAGTIIISRQISYMQNADMGFTSDAVVRIRTPYQYPAEKKQVLKDQFGQIPGVLGISIQAAAPSSNSVNTRLYDFKGKSKVDDAEMHYKGADTAYLRLYNLQLLAGRNLQASDSTREFLINETGMHLLGYQNPAEILGTTLSDDDQKPYPIVGVVRDFHNRSLRDPIYPTLIAVSPLDQRFEIAVKLATRGKGSGDFQEKIKQLEKQWKAVYPGEKFDYSFVDEDIAKYYQNEQRTSKILASATGIAIFISCIGLFGLVSFTVTRRTKEIGVRKILGASVPNIVYLLSRDLLILVLVAMLLGSPIAWYFSQQWLKDFAFHIQVQWWMFVLAGAMAVIVAFLTISFQAIQAALANPVDALSNE